ncbi:MAG: signal peptide peptidase SppA [Ignavibacteriales bacterium]|nr:signal peptide peptidase SppA [Ignavibacteriales bacterium]
MKSKFLKVILMFFIVSIPLNAQKGFQSFYDRNEFLFASPGTIKYGLNGYDNPALLTYVEKFDLMFNWSDRYSNWSDLKHWGLFVATSNFGFGVVHQKIGGNATSDYKVSTALGSRNFSFGISYGWTKGHIEEFNRTDIMSFGVLIRPLKYFSFGLVGTASTQVNAREGYIDLAVRPLGNEIITLFGDYSTRNKSTYGIKKDNWSTGAAVEILSGLTLTGRYFDSKDFTLGINLGLGNIGFSSQAHYNKESHHAYNIYGIRVGGYDRNLFSTLLPPKNYLEMNLLGEVKYQRYKFFDNSNTLYSIIQQINAAKEDKSILGIAINTSGMNANREMLWEIRERLRDFKTSGKKVIIFIDNPDLTIYHFASIADKVVMDPIGYMNLTGYVMGRTFYKNALEKIGVGIDEHRFFKYKSAAESYSREKMSEADKEQRQKLVDDSYDLARREICESRNFSFEQFDNFVNEYGAFLASGALENKLVDTLARWDAIPDIIKKVEKKDMRLVGSSEKLNLPSDNYWSEPKKIAVIYALGACAMDEGINARSLVKDVNAAANDPLVKAIVLRVDSPGGDAMASDYIAEAIKKCKKQKPVIVSQGSVAGSGGYWLSMYGDSIIAAPNTITGSIGVISLWAYNNGFKEKIGLSTDYVKRGEHADLPFGMVIPFLGLSLPDRNLTIDERSRLESYIKTMYGEFVNKVAEGRKLKTEYVDSIGQGRVWSGTDGLKNGLVDILGGLDDAIKLAKNKAGIKEDELVNIIQLPAAQLFNFNFLQPKLFGFEMKEDEFLSNLKFRLQNNGKAMPVIPLEEMDFGK